MTINEIFPLAESRWTCSASKISSNIDSITRRTQENKSLPLQLLANHATGGAEPPPFLPPLVPARSQCGSHQFPARPSTTSRALCEQSSPAGGGGSLPCGRAGPAWAQPLFAELPAVAKFPARAAERSGSVLLTP